MPTNLLKKYADLLELGHLAESQRKASLMGVFKRDIEDNTSFRFRKKPIYPVRSQQPEMQTLFHHLTTCSAQPIVGEEEQPGKRVFDMPRAVRLHWIKHHIDERLPSCLMVFSVEDRARGKTVVRTYVVDKVERYVVVLEPLRKRTDYYLLTAYPLEARNYKKLVNKAKRKLPEVV